MNKKIEFPGHPEQGVRIHASELDDVTCEACGNYSFSKVTLLKRVPADLSPNGEEGMLPLQAFACNACGYVNKDFVKGSWFKGGQGAP